MQTISLTSFVSWVWSCAVTLSLLFLAPWNYASCIRLNDEKYHKFLNETLYNWTQNDVRTRESISVGVAYGTDGDLVNALLLGIAVQEPAILNDPKPLIFFE